MINGNRVKQARELSRVTQAELAISVGIAQSTIAHIEGGLFQPSTTVVEAIAGRLGFPASFFERSDPPNFPLGSLLFRSHRNIIAADKWEAFRLGQMAFEVSAALSKRVRNKIALRLPQLADEPTDYAQAAQLTRSALGLSPDVPITNLTKAVEQCGAIVLTIPARFDSCDAFSLWATVPSSQPNYEIKKPIIVLSSEVPGDRLRLSLAHEIGHLVMHTAFKGATPEIEEEAFRFASELLLPEVAMRQQITLPVTLSTLSVLKPIWGVSIQALIKRAYDLNIIDEGQYRYLYKQINAHDWKKDEPITIPTEKPRAVRQMAEIVYGIPINYQRLAHDLDMYPHFIKKLMDTYATREEYAVRSIKKLEEVNNLFSLSKEEPEKKISSLPKAKQDSAG